jgi:hypothetical protein
VTRWTHPGTRETELSPGTIEQIKCAVGQELRWKEDQRAAMWVGKAIAPILGLDTDDDVLVLKKTIKKLITIGALKTQTGRDERRREPKIFVVAT